MKSVYGLETELARNPTQACLQALLVTPGGPCLQWKWLPEQRPTWACLQSGRDVGAQVQVRRPIQESRIEWRAHPGWAAHISCAPPVEGAREA